MESKDALTVHITKEFPVSTDQLYKAWVTEEDLKQWWKPMGAQLKSVTNELKEGGTVKYEFAGGDDHTFSITGKYDEVKEKELLKYGWNWEIPNEPIENSQYTLTVKFSGQGNSSTLDVTQENFKDEESIAPHKQGWEKSLNDLQQYLSSK